MEKDILKNWENLFVPESIMKAMVKEGFLEPTDIQKLTFPHAIRDRLDILGAAATGTGKTLAFGIPMISRILADKQKEIDLYEAANDEDDDDDNDEKSEQSNGEDDECDLSPSESELEFNWNDDDVNPTVFVGAEPFRLLNNNAKPHEHIYGLVLTPTRELACQVSDHLKKACQFTDLKVCTIFGGMSVEKQERLLNKKPEILVVTPGRFWSFIQDQNPHALSCIKMSVLVIDEADRMLEKGHFAELDNLMDWLKCNAKDRVINGTPMKPRQTLVFSATLTFVHSPSNVSLKKNRVKLTKNDKLKKFVEKLGMSANPKIIDTTIDVAKLSHWRILCPSQKDKDTRLYWFLQHHPGRTIVFANSKNSVRRLTSVLQTLGLSPKSLMADMQQKMRLKKLESFARADNSLLIASDVAARGLDIPRVDFIVHFDVAHTAETHLHRSGRTARASQSGHSIIMMAPGEASQFNKLLFSLKKSESDIRDIPIDGDIDQYEEAVTFAREIESQSHVTKSAVATNNWFNKMAEMADIALDDDIGDLKKTLPSKRANFEQKKKMELLKKMLTRIDQDKSKYVSPIVMSSLDNIGMVTNEPQSDQPGPNKRKAQVEQSNTIKQNKAKKPKK